MSFKTFVKADIKQPQYEHNPDHFSHHRYMEDDLYRKYFDETDFSHYYSSFNNNKPSRFEYHTKVAKSRGKQIKHRDELLQKFYSAEPKKKTKAQEYDEENTAKIAQRVLKIKNTKTADIPKLVKNFVKKISSDLNKIEKGQIYIHADLAEHIQKWLESKKKTTEAKRIIAMLEGRCGIVTLERNCLASEARKIIVKQWKVKGGEMPEKLKKTLKNMNLNRNDIISKANKKGPRNKQKAKKKVNKYKVDIDISLLKKFQNIKPRSSSGKIIKTFLSSIRTLTKFKKKMNETTEQDWQKIIKNLNEVNTEESKERRTFAKKNAMKKIKNMRSAFMKTEPKKSWRQQYREWKPKGFIMNFLKALFWPFVWGATILWYMMMLFGCLAVVAATGVALYIICNLIPVICLGVAIVAVGLSCRKGDRHCVRDAATLIDAATG